MSKETERLAFNWQRSYNQYILLFTIIVTLFSSQGLIPERWKIPFYWLLAISISLFGLSVIKMNGDELIYEWKGLRDKRIKIAKYKKI